jgi:hypothetical protein
MNPFKAYSAALSARKIKFVVRPGASRLVEQEPADLEEAVPQGGEVTFLYRSGKNRLFLIFVGEKSFEDFLVYQEDGERVRATLEGNYASFSVDLLHAPKQIRFNAQGETPRFLTLAFRAIPGRKETLKALRPRIKDLGNSFVLTYKNGNDKARRSEVLLYQKKSQLLHPHTWGNHTYIQSFFPTTGEIVIPHEPSDCLALRFKQFDENGSLLFDTGFLDPHLYDDEQELALDLEECAFLN